MGSRSSWFCSPITLLQLLISLEVLLHVTTQEDEHYTNNSIIDNSDTNLRDSKYMSVFTLVRFANTECQGYNGLTGTCYHGSKCFFGGGTSAGICASGYGVCCTSKISCGSSSSLNRTILASPGYGESFNYGLDCIQTIVIDSTICQLRLDITELKLYYPDSTGNCHNDYFTVSDNTMFDRVCGITTDNHFYLAVDSSVATKVDFTFHTNGDVSFERKWKIGVSMIQCGSLEAAPKGCGQYYTGTSGTIKGFNKEASESYYYLSGMKYSICVRMEARYCSATYTENYSVTWLPRCNDLFEWPDNFKTRSVPNPHRCSSSFIN